MSDYSQVTNFTAKDALTLGDPEKAILGSDVDAEFAAIQTAIASKIDSTDLSAFTSGSFSYTLSAGGSSSSSGTMYYRIVNNVCTLWVQATLSCTSTASAGPGLYDINTSAITAGARPATDRNVITQVHISSTYSVLATLFIPASGILAFTPAVSPGDTGITGQVGYRYNTLSPEQWPASTGLGLQAGWTVTYPL